jgi:hypothetical protein
VGGGVDEEVHGEIVNWEWSIVNFLMRWVDSTRFMRIKLAGEGDLKEKAPRHVGGAFALRKCWLSS